MPAAASLSAVSERDAAEPRNAPGIRSVAARPRGQEVEDVAAQRLAAGARFVPVRRRAEVVPRALPRAAEVLRIVQREQARRREVAARRELLLVEVRRRAQRPALSCRAVLARRRRSSDPAKQNPG